MEKDVQKKKMSHSLQQSMKKRKKSLVNAKGDEKQTSGVDRQSAQKNESDKGSAVREKREKEETKYEEKAENIFAPFVKSGDTLSDIVFANLILLSAVLLTVFLPVVNLALPVLVFLYMEVGLFGFVLVCENDGRARFEEMFVHIKKFVRIFCVFVVKLFTIAFWLCVFIVPGVVCFLNYSFSSLIIFENGEIDARGVLMLSKELTKGHRLKIFLSMLIALASVCAAVAIMFAIILFADVFCVVPKIYYIIFLTVAGVLDFVLMALPLVEVAVVDAYILAKRQAGERKSF